MPISGKKMLALAKRNGWILDRVSSSHHIVIKNGVHVSIPVHKNQDLKKGIEHTLKRQLGI